MMVVNAEAVRTFLPFKRVVEILGHHVFADIAD